MVDQAKITAARKQREERIAAREANVAKSKAEAQELAVLSEQQAAAKKAGEPVPSAAPKPQQVKPLSKKERQALDQARAEKQAEEDVKRVVDNIDIKAEMARAAQEGRPLPLHVLNAMAKEADRSIKDEAKEIANAAGKAAYAVAAGKQHRLTRSGRISRLLKSGMKLDE